jgi:hypothetical protein
MKQMQVGAIAFCFAAFAANGVAQLTFSKDIAGIMAAKCQQCHRDGDVAPFAINGYDDVVTWSDDIVRVLQAKTMPPWKPVAGHGEFRDAFNLTDDERRTIISWIADGMAPGDPADTPDIPPPAGTWQLGDPDMVIQMPQVFDVPRTKDLYRCFVIPTDFDTQQFISAVQVVPGNKQIVHHVILYIDTTGKADQLDGKDGQPGYTCFGGPGDGVATTLGNILGGWVPGQRTRALPDGIAVALPPKARVVMQVHYYPSGKPGPDQTKVGVYFAKAQVDRRLIFIPVIQDKLKIQPDDANAVRTASFAIPPFLDAKGIVIAPHMHLLGRTINVELQSADKQTTTPMIFIDDWDFNWQGFYTWTEPVPLPALSTIKLTCSFDNTTNNPRNPNNPLKVVDWGEGTEDEMCLAFIGVTFNNENLVKQFLPFQKKPAQ